MHPVRALFLKELRQHRWTFAALGGMLVVTLLVLLWSASRAVRVVTLLQYSGVFLVLFIPLAGVVLANRIVTQEYSGRTQLFLEGLPIPRVHMVTTKFVIGLGCLLLMALIALTSICSFAAQTEPLGPRFLAILTLKSCSFVVFVWAVLFLLGIVGRFRIPIAIAAVLILSYLNATKEMEFTRSGPLALINSQTYASERTVFGWRPLIQTNLASLGCIVLSYLLALFREGSVAEALAHRMTQREKATVGTMVLLGTMGAVVLDAKKPKQPYEFQSETVVRSESLPIAILFPGPPHKPVAQQLLARLERSLGRMADALRIVLPPTRITYGFALDAGMFETADLAEADGLLVRTNYDDPSEPRQRALEAYVIRGLLDLTTRGRCRFEPKRWLHDGFPVWWTSHGDGDADAGRASEPVMLARAVEAARHIGSLPEGVARWTALRETLGEPIAEALAYSGLAFLEREAGRDAVLGLARSVLGRRAPEDARETIREWAHPMAAVFAESTGMTWDTFVSGWARWLEAQQEESAVAAILARVPSLSGAIHVGAREGLIREIVGRFDGEVPGPGLLGNCVMLHCSLGPFDHELEPGSLLREETDCSEGIQPLEMVGLYAPGERVFVALEIDSTALDVPVRLLSRRMVLR